MVNDVYICDDFKHQLYDAELLVSRGFDTLMKGESLTVPCISDASGFMYPIKNSPFVSMFTSMLVTPIDQKLSESKQCIVSRAKERFCSLNSDAQYKILEALPLYKFKFQVLDDEADLETYKSFKDSNNDAQLLIQQ